MEGRTRTSGTGTSCVPLMCGSDAEADSRCTRAFHSIVLVGGPAWVLEPDGWFHIPEAPGVAFPGEERLILHGVGDRRLLIDGLTFDRGNMCAVSLHSRTRTSNCHLLAMATSDVA